MAATFETFVRAARGSDAPALADLQLGCWQEAYSGVLPAESLAAMAAGRDEIVERWRASAADPPGPRYHVLVAVDGGTELVGAAAVGPAEESPDLNPAAVGELLVLQVAAAHRRSGNGSRLLAASVDHLREDGFVHAVLWVDDADGATAALLLASGWAPDGTTRTLDLDADGAVLVHQARWHTDLSPSADSDPPSTTAPSSTTAPPPEQEDRP
jgi:GNAT superfamily N-acetyltransferase